MEGYSVTEAASILGVPTERVWELLARGVLSGAPEGETGMRVYLQPRPAPAPPAAEPSRQNGDAEPTRELSPFRELLTEFRNLTERYGQALLALGEARGEVAALRSRVDLLEARMDLRLPMTAGPMTPPTPWPTPMPVAPTPTEAPAGLHDAVDQHAEGEERPRRRGARRATESFAEALARAEDPTRPELPDAAETAAALAALREESVESVAGDAILPRELPAAEHMPLAEELEPDRASETEPEGEPVADGADAQPEPTVQAVAHPEEVAEAEAQPEPLPEPEAVVTAEPEPQPAAEWPTTAGEAVEPVDEAAAESEAGPAVASAEAAEDGVIQDVPAEPIAWDPERYTVDIVEPDWYAEEEPEATSSVTAPSTESEPEPVVPTTEPPPSELSDTPAAEDVQAVDDGGADEIEVVGASQRTGPAHLPGSQELDDALAALDALAPPAESETAPPAEPAPAPPPATPAEADTDDDGWPPTIGSASVVPPSPREKPDLPRGGTGSLTSLTRPPATPASRAYRRLRRIFPG